MRTISETDEREEGRKVLYSYFEIVDFYFIMVRD